MDSHKNARLTPKGREEMVCAVVDGGLTEAAAARRLNTSPKTVAKWVKRFRAEGVEGSRDRSSRPLPSPGQIPAATSAIIEALRRQRYTGKHIANELKVSPATVSRILRRMGLNRIRDLEPAEPERRYERETPGEMIHIDIKTRAFRKRDRRFILSSSPQKIARFNLNVFGPQARRKSRRR